MRGFTTAQSILRPAARLVGYALENDAIYQITVH